ncbi:MAG: PEP-CTERM sorting domain-containing protein [Alphaproteobacteria bacterium]|nr:PEP-CTERM sorting domain-containing protein [Alphaproteobacteria bacterium]
MLKVFHFAVVAGTLAAASLANPAYALFAYAPNGEEAALQGGGEAISSNAIVEGSSSLTFNTIGVASRTYEFLNTIPATLTAPPILALTEGSGNNGLSFSIDFQRSSGPTPYGQSGTIEFVITNTNSISVQSFPGTQVLIANFSIDLVAPSTYISPVQGAFTIVGSSTTATPQVNYNYSIVVPGSDPTPTTAPEPAMLAVIGGGLLTLGAIGRRRRRRRRR